MKKILVLVLVLFMFGCEFKEKEYTAESAQSDTVVAKKQAVIDLMAMVKYKADDGLSMYETYDVFDDNVIGELRERGFEITIENEDSEYEKLIIKW